MRKTISALAACSLLALGACESVDNALGGRQNTSTAAGAVLGAVLGASVAGDDNDLLGAALGAAIGGYIGRQLGKEWTGESRNLHDRAASRALWNNAVGQPERWSDSQTNTRGEVTPISNTFRNASGDTCRRFRDMVIDGGSPPRTIEATACLRNDQWVVNA